MELRHLRYFVAVAEELHFRRAAERLHVAQPAVSEQVRKLEDELGVKLLERTHRSVSLTDAGAAMLEHARVVLRLADAAQRAARDASARTTARLRIGYTTAALPSSVPRALHRVASAGHIETTLEPGSRRDLVEAVRDERLDAAIVPLPVAANGLRVTELAEQGAVAAVAIGHDHATRSAINLEQVAPERLLLLPRDANRPFHDAVVAACHDAGLSPTLVELADADVEQALLMVASGAGMALLPESVAERYLAPGVRFLPLEGARPVFSTGVLTRRESEHLPTAAFVHALSRGIRRPAPQPAQPAAVPVLALAG
ncbi:MAG TPA: LysR family transcriptional regulator [Thermoleophilaceae bacterium]|jgi:DNA-binding transcriptional LysR family regulator